MYLITQLGGGRAEIPTELLKGKTCAYLFVITKILNLHRAKCAMAAQWFFTYVCTQVTITQLKG